MDLIAKVRRPGGTLDILPCDWAQLRPDDDDQEGNRPRYVSLSQDGTQFLTIDMSADATDVYIEQGGRLVTHVQPFRLPDDVVDYGDTP